MKKFALLGIILLLLQRAANAQGCVAIRSTGSTCSMLSPQTAGGWRAGISYRYFKSYRHFVGTEEQKQREEQRTEVINWQHALNFELIRNFNGRWSMGLYIPVLANTRSSLYEHGGNSAGDSGRHSTRSFGLGDVRIAAYRWLLDPAKSQKINVQVGLGLKFATGDYRYQDFFIKSPTSKIPGPVDQSIQLGDGGTGFTAEVNGYYNFSHRLNVYSNLYYLLNPREQNAVSAARGETASSSAVLYGSSVMSVPDQYMIRAGANYVLNRLSFSAGIRHECIPSSDLVGGSSGFRRPGYVTSLEPGLNYELKNGALYVTGPVAIWRNRTQSFADKKRTAATGVYAHGDAAFADFAINLGFSFRF
jgi:hypothetical protein